MKIMERHSTGHSQVIPETTGGNRGEITVNIGDLSRRLRALKAEKDWSTEEMARQLSVSPRTIRDWMRERSEPRMSRRKELNAKINSLLSEVESKPEPTQPKEVPGDQPTEANVEPAPEKPILRPLVPTDLDWSL